LCYVSYRPHVGNCFNRCTRPGTSIFFDWDGKWMLTQTCSQELICAGAEWTVPDWESDACSLDGVAEILRASVR
jgi:hypothetical protein